MSPSQTETGLGFLREDSSQGFRCLWLTFSSSYSSESAPSFCMNGAKCDWMFPSSSFARFDQFLPWSKTSTPLAPSTGSPPGNHGWTRVAKTLSYPMFSKVLFSIPVERRTELELEDVILLSMAAAYDPEAFQRAVPFPLKSVAHQTVLKSILRKVAEPTWLQRGLGAVSLSRVPPLFSISLLEQQVGSSGFALRGRN